MQLSDIWMRPLGIWAYDIGQVEDTPSGPRPQPGVELAVDGHNGYSYLC
jgi:hypothetical protein